MSANDLQPLANAIEILSGETGGEIESIVRALVPECFDEEEAGELLDYMIGGGQE